MFFQLKWFDPSQSSAAISTQAGVLIGAKTAAQVCTGMFWGRFADSEFGGRKTVLSIGLISAGISMLGYGFSRSYTSAIIWQIINGCMNANVSMVRCMVAELNPEKRYSIFQSIVERSLIRFARYRTRALLLLPLFANAGTLLGPLIGGLLVSNDTHMDKNSLTKRYPYAAPNIVIAFVYAIAALGVIFGVEETLDSLKDGGQSFAGRVYQKVTQRTRDRRNARNGYSTISSSDDRTDQHEVETSNNSINSPLLGNGHGRKKRKLAFRRIWTFNVICTLLSTFVVSVYHDHYRPYN